MAHWSECAVTNGGAAMLNEWMAGRTITITSVYGGTGLVDADRLTEQTGLADQRQTLSLLGQTDGEGGKNLQIQVSNRGLEAEYELNQIGVYAVLDKGRDSETEEQLLFLMQDRRRRRATCWSCTASSASPTTGASKWKWTPWAWSPWASCGTRWNGSWGTTTPARMHTRPSGTD